MRDVLDYFPIAGTVLLTGGIIGFGVYQFRQSRQKIGDALRGRYHSGGVISASDIRDRGIPTIISSGREMKLEELPPSVRQAVERDWGDHVIHMSNPGDPNEFRNTRHPQLPALSRGAGSVPSLRAGPLLSAEELRDAYRSNHPELFNYWNEHGELRVRYPDGRDEPGGIMLEVTSEICDLCDVIGGHDNNCPRYIIEQLSRHAPLGDARDAAAVSGPASSARGDQAPARTLREDLLDAVEDEGEPLPTPPAPNMGGIGNPQYQGPHYDSVLDLETRFAPYDVLREPLPGAAVHFAGDAACAGPIDLHREGERHGETDTRRSEGEQPDGDRERD